MISRKDVDGQDRAAVFAALRSFDHRAVGSEAERLERTFGLMDLSRAGLAEVRTAVARGAWAEARDRLSAHYAARAYPLCEKKADPPDPGLADEILENTFTFYGEKHALGPDIDWEVNPGTAHWGHDLNRFSYMRSLVGAFLRLGDRRYAEKAVGLILDWIGKTDICDAFIPRKSPYVWLSYLNIHIHLTVWAETLEVLLPEGVVSPADLATILKSAHDQLAYLEVVIPEQDSNWVVFGATGMLRTSLCFEELRDAGRWVRYAWDRFEEQVDNQVLPDGVQFELTQHYHFGVARSYVAAVSMTTRAGRQAPAKAREAARKMAHYLHQTVTPDRRHLAFNDSDPNCGPSVAAFVTDPETLSACGEGSSRVTDGRTFEDLPSEAFPCAGVYIMRDRNLYMAFDGGPYGAHHQHEDKLSFWLAAYGRSLIVDPGRYLYDNKTPFRAYLMSTRAHNTILVDGQGQSSRRRRDLYVSREPLPNPWDATPARVRTGATYDLGYGKDGEIPVTHRRSVLFVAGKYWILFDRLEGTGVHEVESRFQFMPGEAVIRDGGVCTRFEDANVMVRPVAGAGFEAGIEKGQEEPRGGWYSDGYNLLEPAPQAAFRVRAALPFGAATLLLPYRGPAPPEVIFEKAEGGRYRVVVSGEEAIYREAEIVV